MRCSWRRTERGAVLPSRRRALKRAAGLVLAGLPLSSRSQSKARVIRIGVTAVILDDQVSFLNEWKGYLQERLDRPVAFVHRSMSSAELRAGLNCAQKAALDRLGWKHPAVE